MKFPFFPNHGLLGMNARNLLYIKEFNPRAAVAFADDKLKTKAFLAARGIPVAKIFGRIEDRTQLAAFDFSQLPDVCVLKPNEGFGGEGILILRGRNKHGEFLEQGKHPLSKRALTEHIEDILDGRYSLGGRPDVAFFEKLLVPHEGFAPFRPAGLPDVRIVVFNFVPVMAMLRIPTAESHGKANVHQGGFGIGIDVSKGTTTHAMQYGHRIVDLPFGGSPSGIVLPHWEEMLLIASRIQSLTNIGYLAVDLTVDSEQGPVLLEVNARAGLSLQVANLAPLRSRLERVAGLQVSSPEKGVRLAQDLFGEKRRVEESPEHPGRPVLGLHETLLITADRLTMDVPALLSPEEERTLIEPTLLQELIANGSAQKSEGGEENGYRLKFSLGGQKIQTVVHAAHAPMPQRVRAVVGRRDLTGFLLDPSRSVPTKPKPTKRRDDARAIDHILAQMDEELLLLKHLKPANLDTEVQRCMEDAAYQPLFQYVAMPTLDVSEQKLLSLEPDDSPLGMLLRKKRRELLQRISLLRSRGDTRRFTEASCALFGMPSTVLLSAARAVLDAAPPTLPEDPSMMSADEAAPAFQEALDRYGLHEWSVVVREKMVARCTVGDTFVYLRQDARFSQAELLAVIAHEVETHVLTAQNGSLQPYELLRRGCAHYIDTQEGLAVVNQNRFLPEHHAKRLGPARRILGAAFALEHGFADTRRYLTDTLGYDDAEALHKAIDMKRGITDTSQSGAFTRGIVYFRGQRAIEQFLAAGGDLSRLYIGKIALEDLEILETIPELKPPLLLPTFLQASAKPEKKKRATKKQ